LKEEALDRTMWRNRFGGGFEPVVRQNTEWNETRKRPDTRKKLLNIKLCFDFLYNFCLTHFSFQEKMSDMWSKMYWSLCKVPINSCQILIKLEFSWQVFEKYSNIKFHEYPSSGSWAVPFGKTDMTKLRATFHNSANTPKTPHFKGWIFLCVNVERGKGTAYFGGLTGKS
jgi:hypothetical protein